MPGALSLGLSGTLGPAAIARIARAAEDAGFASLWVNDTTDGDPMALLAAAAARTARIRLATGVLPVDRRPPAEILAAAADLPADRLTLGIGSGGARTGQVDLVAHAIDALRSGTTATILIGALGPRMRRLAAERADGALLSWLSPDIALHQSAEAHAIRSSTLVALYVRTALDDAAIPRLRDETALYARFPHYAANYARLGLDPADTVLEPPGLAGRLLDYRAAVDEVVLRPITRDDRVETYERFVERAAALAAPAD